MTKFSNAASCYGWQGWVGFGISAGKMILLHAAYARVKTYAKALPSARSPSLHRLAGVGRALGTVAEIKILFCAAPRARIGIKESLVS
jgi:hypothetical protein